LFLDPVEERGELRVVFVRDRIVEVDRVDRPGDLLGQAVGQNAAEDEHQHHDPEKRRQKDEQHRRDGVLRAGHAEHGSVREADGVIVVALQERFGVAGALAGAGLERLRDLLAVQVVFHCAGVRDTVIQHLAASRDPGDAVRRRERFEIRFIRALERVGDLVRLDLQPVERLVLVVAVHDAEKEHAADDQNRNADQK